MTVKGMTLNLRVLAQIPAHGRLKRRSGGGLDLDCDVPMLTCVARFLNSDSRTRAMGDIEMVVDEVEEKTNDWLGSKSPEQQQLQTLAHNVQEACSGLQTLKTTTYSRDAIIVGQLDILIDRLHTAVKRITLCS